MRCSLCLLLVLLSTPVLAEVVLDFEDAALGEVLDTKYSPLGVQLTGVGDGGPFPVIADAPCASSGSGSFVLSLRAEPDCPEINDSTGWYEVDFEVEQPRVSVTAIANGPVALIYFEAYDDLGLLDQKLGDLGDDVDGVPQILEIEREPHERQITRVRFGAVRSGQTASFDDLSYENVPVSVSAQSWSAVKGRFGP